MKKSTLFWIAIVAAIILFISFAGDSGSSSYSSGGGNSSYDRDADIVGDAYGMDGDDVKDQVEGFVGGL